MKCEVRFMRGEAGKIEKVLVSLKLSHAFRAGKNGKILCAPIDRGNVIDHENWSSLETTEGLTEKDLAEMNTVLGTSQRAII